MSLSDLKAKVHNLLDFMLAVESLKMTAARQIAKEWIALHQGDVKGLEGLHFNQRSGDQDIWLRIDRLGETAPPAPKADLAPWIDLSRSPSTPPILRNSIQVATGEEQRGATVMLDSKPEVRPLFEAYLTGWKAWAATELRRRTCIAIYRKLFVLQQTITNEGAEQPVELVWGMALASWQPPDRSTPILHPLLTQACDININPKTFAIEIGPAASRPKLELACYVELGLAGCKALEATWRSLQETEGDIVNPFEESSFGEIAKVAVSNLDPDGRYEARTDDLSVPTPAERLVITSTWCLFARKRTADLIIDDIKALQAHINDAAEVPNLVARFVRPAVGAITRGEPRAYRGVSSIGGSKEGTEEHDLFFPLPYNDEQVSIVQRLDDADGVVVQGPPGTGKSHTIANVISHYLATGRKILVTAKSESALAVLREKLPEEIRPLSVALLTAEGDGNRQFESNIKVIDAELSRLDPRRTGERITRLQGEIDALHTAIAEADKQIEAKARPNIQPLRIDGKEVSIMELARQVVEDEPRHSWFTDIPPTEPGPELTEAVIDALRAARRRVGEDLRYLEEVLPAMDGLPTSDQLLTTHHDLQRVAKLELGQRHGATLALKAVRSDVLAALRDLKQAIAGRRQREQTLAQQPWTQGLATELRRASSTDPVVTTLRGLIAQILAAEHQRRTQVAKAIDVPDGAEADPEIRQALTRLTAGKSAFLLPFGHSEQRKLLAAIRIAGSPASDPDHWKAVADVLAWRDSLQRLHSQWQSLSRELGLPQVSESTAAGLMRSLKAAADLVAMVVDSVYEHDKSLAMAIARVFAPCPETAPAASLANLDRIASSVDAHLEHAEVTYALEQRRSYQAQLAGCRGDLVTQFAAVFDEQLGKDIDDATLLGTWRGLTAELQRRTQLVSALTTIRTATDLLNRYGAPIWAERLRTKHQDHSTDFDPLLPSDWGAAWRWRRHETFLRRVDAHQDMHRLFVERQRLARTLANTYQALAAARTWDAVGKHAGADVRAALKAYLSFVLKIGRGTGKNAVVWRRDAKRAMSNAYRGVPCWILPHWRVSEALPAQLGLFDLVVVDEASQSDLSCLPAILRGKKLLVVGDDKQVSPSTVGLSVEKLADLRNRYLSGLPENVGPLMLPGSSLYELANVVFAGQGVMLREHFRSVAPLIEWSNQTYYDGAIIPLRVPTATERLDPPLVDVYVPNGKRRGDINEGEARAIVDEIKAICRNPALAGRTLGVVTLLGQEQAHHIHTLISNEIPPQEILQRHLSVGPPPVFQGRERDIMLVSMVLDRDSRGASNANEYHQRYNVALSRARDRMYLFRSITEETVNRDSPTGKVLAYFRQPVVATSTADADARARCESPFEGEVYDELVARGFRVLPQVKAGIYRIDLVVEDVAGRRLAVECDGDRFHGPGQWDDDMARQRVLERAGWVFWRCFASTWARRRQDCIDDLMATLGRLGIEPAPPTAVPALVESRVYSPSPSRNDADSEDEIAAVEDAAPAPIPEPVVPATALTPLVDPLPSQDASTSETPSDATPLAEGSRSDKALLVNMLSLIPDDGSTIGNVSLRSQLASLGYALSEADYFAARQVLIDAGHCESGRGRGGSVRRVIEVTPLNGHEAGTTGELFLRLPQVGPPPNPAVVEAMLALLPEDGSSIGNVTLKRLLEEQGIALSDTDYFSARQILIERGLAEKGQGRGGSVRRI